MLGPGGPNAGVVHCLETVPPAEEVEADLRSIENVGEGVAEIEENLRAIEISRFTGRHSLRSADFWGALGRDAPGKQ